MLWKVVEPLRETEHLNRPCTRSFWRVSPARAEAYWNGQLRLHTLRKGCHALHHLFELGLPWHLRCYAFRVNAAVLYLGEGRGGLGLLTGLWYSAGFWLK